MFSTQIFTDVHSRTNSLAKIELIVVNFKAILVHTQARISRTSFTDPCCFIRIPDCVLPFTKHTLHIFVLDFIWSQSGTSLFHSQWFLPANLLMLSSPGLLTGFCNLGVFCKSCVHKSSMNIRNLCSPPFFL